MSPERQKSNMAGSKRFRQINCSPATLYLPNFQVTTLPLGTSEFTLVTVRFCLPKTPLAASAIRHWLAGVTISSDMEESLALLLAHKALPQLRHLVSRGQAKLRRFSKTARHL